MVKQTHCKKGHELTEENIYITPSSGKRRCKICADKYREQNKAKLNARSIQWQKDNRERSNKKSNRWKKNNHDKVNASRKKWFPEYKKELRIKVLSHYGGNQLSCVCCGETILDLLTLDHINGIKNTNDNGKRAWMLLQYLRAHNYPEGYQTLCWNCNSGRSNNGGICPHKTEEILRPVSKRLLPNPSQQTLRQRERMRKYVKIIRSETLTHYGNGKLECICCKINKIQFLTLDHINGRKKEEIKNSKFRGWQLMRKLRYQGYPEGYQTLCWNCNSGRQLNKGVCPHKLIDNNKSVSI